MPAMASRIQFHLLGRTPQRLPRTNVSTPSARKTREAASSQGRMAEGNAARAAKPPAANRAGGKQHASVASELTIAPVAAKFVQAFLICKSLGPYAC